MVFADRRVEVTWHDGHVETLNVLLTNAEVVLSEVDAPHSAFEAHHCVLM